MKNRFMLSAILAPVLLMAPSVCAQALTIGWSSTDSGGGLCTGGAFSLSGTIGQHDIGVPLTGGGFTLSGGYWPGSPGTSPNCPANIVISGTSASRVDVDDLLAVITSWGTWHRLARRTALLISHQRQTATAWSMSMICWWSSPAGVRARDALRPQIRPF